MINCSIQEYFVMLITGKIAVVDMLVVRKMDTLLSGVVWQMISLQVLLDKC